MLLAVAECAPRREFHLDAAFNKPICVACRLQNSSLRTASPRGGHSSGFSKIAHRAAAVALAIIGLDAAPIGAAASVCQPLVARELFYAAQASIADNSRIVPGHQLSVARTAFRVRAWSRTDHTVRIAHDYRAHHLDTSVGEPQTNGHLHRLGPRYRFARKRWNVAASPVIATSSNVGRHPGAISRALIDWHGSLRYGVRLGAHITGYAGVCRDDRFGRVRISPLLGLEWQAGDRWRGRLAWPDADLAWRFPHRWRRWQVSAAVNPVGGSWAVYDNALARRTRFEYQGWRMRVGVGFQPSPAHRIAVSVGREARRSLRFQQGDGDGLSSTFKDARVINVEWQWLASQTP